MKGAYLTSATALKVYQQRVRALANTANPSWTLTLPPVSEAAGFIYSLHATIANAQAVTVTDHGDDPDFTNLTLDADGDAALLYSDGARWWVIANEIA
jgi:hypothetical protein